MAKFLVKASEFKNVCKAVNDRKLAELKKEIIEILKKQDENEVKKAIDYFNSQELHYTHLEKSLSGKWIEKAGYGIGTVRVWKGKKYKKIAPGKWARVFDKEGRGTNIAIGKLIAKVQKIDNVEDLMAFVMQNKQRFVDENGVDLPVLDKLRAAVDARNGNVESKTDRPFKNANKEDLEFVVEQYKKQPPTHEIARKQRDQAVAELSAREKEKPAKNTDGKYDRELVDSWKDDYKDFSTDVLKEKIEEYTKVLERVKNDNPNPDQRVAVKQNEHRLKALNELLEEKKNKPAEKKEVDYSKMSEDELNELNKKLRQTIKEKDYGEADEEMEQINKISKQKIINSYKTKEKHTLQYVEDVEQKKKMIADSKAIVEKELARKEKQRAKESSIAKKNQLADEIDELKYKKAAFEQLEKEVDEDPRTGKENYWIQDIRGNRLTNEDAKSRIIDNNMQIFKLNGSNEPRKDMKIRELKNENEYLMDRLNTEDKAEVEIPDYASKLNSDESRKLTEELERLQEGGESEAEKTQNRSEAMKGNKKARKFGTDWEEKRKEIQGKLTENTDKLLEDNDNAKDAYEKLQNHLNKRKADAELYRKYLGNQEEPEDVKDFRKWCDDVIEQYRKEVTNTPSKEIISKWEETAKNTPTEKLEEVYNGKQKVDYTNYYENYIDSTIINTFAKDKDLIFPQPYTMLKDIATRKFDNSDKIRLEIIKRELESRKNKMEKSLFDDFIVDVFAADDEEELEHELYEGETEYNDYSAEQPELFNSTSMKVREALDRIRNQVL